MSGGGARLRRRLLFGLLVLVLIAAGTGGFFAYQVQQVPEFYQQAIAAAPERQVEAAEQFEHSALEVQNSIQRDEPWRVELTADEINGWLATVLPEKFPTLLPPEVREPRVALAPERFLAAAKVDIRGIETVVSIELSAYLTERTNEIAVRIHSVAAGNVPIPLQQYLDQITARAAEKNIVIRWQEIDGDPLGIVTLPLAEPGEKREIIVRSIELRQGSIVVTGTAEEIEPTKDDGRGVQSSTKLYTDDEIRRLATHDIDKTSGEGIDIFQVPHHDVVPAGESHPRAQVFQSLHLDDARVRDFRHHPSDHVEFLTWQVSPSYDICCMTATNDAANRGLELADPQRKVYGIRLLKRSPQADRPRQGRYGASRSSS